MKPKAKLVPSTPRPGKKDEQGSKLLLMEHTGPTKHGKEKERVTIKWEPGNAA